MRVMVTGQSPRDPDVVQIQAPGGVLGWCTWPGVSIGAVENVELDVAAGVSWTDIRVWDEREEITVPPGHDAVLIGTLQEVDDLGVAILSLRGQGLQMLDVFGPARLDILGRDVAVHVRAVTEYPINE